MKLTSRDLAELVGGELVGDPSIVIVGPSKIEEGGTGTVSFLANMKYEQFFYDSTASVIIVDRNFIPKQSYKASLIKVDDVYTTVSNLLEQFQSSTKSNAGVHPQAIVKDPSGIDSTAYIGPLVVIEQGVKIGANTTIMAQSYVGRNVSIGANCVIHPGVRIYHDCLIGDNCVLHSNVVIGCDGFGYAPDETGKFKKVPQLGNVILADDVEIGSNTTIDRATMGSTMIGRGSKIDNLVQIAHNVKIGENTVVAAQTGIAGSTKIGNYVMLGGQVGIAGHLQIADGTKVQAQTGIGTNIIEKNTKWYGSPAIDYFTYLRAYSEFKKLPETIKKLLSLERRVNQLEDNKINDESKNHQ